MKIGIVTFHFVNNFGGALQTYALYNTLKKQFRVSPIIINYRNWFITFTDTVRLFPISKNIKEIFCGIKTFSYRLNRLKKFNKFITDNLEITKKYYSNEGLKRCSPNCDIYICGSDQIWNPMITGGIDKVYYLDFAKEKKIAFAPSFGSEAPPAQFLDKISPLLKNMDSLSVREKASGQVIYDLTGKNVESLIDPTFLLRKNEWESICVKSDVPKEYILLYIMQNDSSLYTYVEQLKKKTGLPIVNISRYGYNPAFIDYTLIDVGPQEFLGLFSNAKYVCTNSYHGLAFSIIFEKELYLIASKRFNSRMKNLLNLLELDDKNQLEKSNIYRVKHNTEHVHNILERERKKAIEYLKNNLF